MNLPWHDDDEVWSTFQEFLFPRERWERVGEELDHVLRLAGAAPGARVLDLACGPGRHTLELARRGFAVVGVDRTLQKAQQHQAHQPGDGGLGHITAQQGQRGCPQRRAGSRPERGDRHEQAR